MKVFGAILIVVGILALAYAGLNSDRQRAAMDLAQHDEATTEPLVIPLSPVAGAIGVVGGILLVVTPRRRSESVGDVAGIS